MDKGSLLSRFILVTVFLSFGLLAFGSVCYESPTVDEIEHIASGYYFLVTGLSPFNFSQPPLIKLLSAAPLLALPLNTGLYFEPQGYTPLGVLYGFNLFYKVANDPQAIVLFARAAIFSFNCALLLFAARLVSRMYGRLPALFFAILLISSPTFFAHARYVTMDVSLSLLIFISLLTFCRYQTFPSQRTLTLCIGAIVAALAVKFSALIIFPVLLCSSFMMQKKNFTPNSSRRFTSRTYIRTLLIFIACLSLYSLLYVPIATRGKIKSLSHASYEIQNESTTQSVRYHNAPGGTSLLISGIKMQLNRVMQGGIEFGYLAGEMYKGGKAAFFPVLFLLKEQILWLILIFSGVFLEIYTSQLNRRHRSNLHLFLINSLALFILCYGMICVFGNLNLGLRHLLPIYPPLVLIATLGHLRFAKFCLRSFTGVKAAVLVCAGGILLSYPHYLPHFNFIGGGKNGYVWGIDSNFDWGQDTMRFVHWMNQMNIAHAYIDYFGRGNPHYYLKERITAWTGTKGVPPAGSTFVISATRLQQARARRASYPTDFPYGNSYEWIESLTPMQVIGRSIFVYKIPQDNP